MSSLVSGQIIAGVSGKYRLLERLGGDGQHQSIVFKAEVVLIPGYTHDPKWVVVKTASPGNEDSRLDLKREYDTYHKPNVASSTFIRSIYDTVDGSQILVLEYMEHTLATLKYDGRVHGRCIIKAVVEAVFHACAALNRDDLVDTDMKTDKIMISNIESDDPIVKLGDLGLVHLNGSRIEVQPYAMRAPEVYGGYPCTHYSLVWSVAASLLCWIKPGILGTAGNWMHEFPEVWCIAKLMRLFPSWTNPPVTDDIHQCQVNLAKAYINDNEPEIVKISPLKNELWSVDMLPELRNLLLRLFVVDPNERLSPAEVLVSEEYLALVKNTR